MYVLNILMRNKRTFKSRKVTGQNYSDFTLQNQNSYAKTFEEKKKDNA